MYYQEYKEIQRLMTNTQDRIYGEIVSLKRTIEPLIELEEYSSSAGDVWADMQASAEKIVQATEIRVSINRSLEEKPALSNMHSTFTNFLYFIRHTRHALSSDYTYEVGSCDNVKIITDEDINKRLTEYNQLLDYFDPVENSYMELVNNWDTQQSYQINSCGNW